MDLRTVVNILARRWIVVVPAVAVAVVVGVRLVGAVDPQYEANGAVALLAPVPAQAAAPSTPTASSAVAANPLLNVPSSLHRSASLVAAILDGDEQKDAIERRGGSRDYDVVVDRDAPVLHVTATATRRSVAIETVRAVMDAARQQVLLREEGAGVPDADRLATDVVSEPTRTTPLHGAQVRTALAVSILGLAAVLGIALLAENWAQVARRSRERDGEIRDDEMRYDEMRYDEVIVPPRAAPVSDPETTTAMPEPEEPEPVAAGSAAVSPPGQPAPDDVEIDLAAAEREAAASAAAKHPGRARAKPRRRSGASS